MQNWSCDNADAPLLSVRCITYNQEQYISQALDGFLMQKTNFPFEVIVHDDASNDRTADIIREYEKKFPKIIKPIYETENQYSKADGSLARIVNAACKGKYIAFCEGDDYWIDEKKLQMQVDFLEKNPEYGMCYTDVDIFIENENRWCKKIVKNKVTVFDFENPYNTKGYLCNCTWCFRKEIFDNLSENKKIYIDGCLRLFYDMLLCSKMKFLDCVTSVYRRCNSGVSHFSDDQLGKRYVFEKSNFLFFQDYLPKFGFYEENYKRLFEKNLNFLFPYAIQLNDNKIIDAYIDYLKKTKFEIFIESVKMAKMGREILESKPYKVVKFLLAPYRYLKKKLKRNNSWF